MKGKGVMKMSDMAKRREVLSRLRGGLIVSCQALEDEPLHSSAIMGRMAYAAMLGGACGIRANTPQDIAAIKREVKLPIIGLTKRVFADSPVYITPTMREVDDLHEVGCDIIAMDATNRPHTGGLTIEALFAQARAKYPDQLFMADVATFEEGVAAEQMGFDLVSTTLSGYTADTAQETLPDFRLMHSLARTLTVPVIGEGGIWSPQDLRKAMEQGVFACVVGTAITRPREITRRFVEALAHQRCEEGDADGYAAV